MRHLLPLLLPILLCTCDRAQTSGDLEIIAAERSARHQIRGEAMGSYFQITYLGDSIPNLKRSVDSLLDAYNLELSAWVPDSRLSQFNRLDEGVDLEGTLHFIPNLELASRISQATGGAYDPTIAPLVNFWGFGTGEERDRADYDPAEITRLLDLVGLGNVSLEGTYLRKRKPGVQLDLNASAKGYGVDLIADLMSRFGRPDHLVDIGGEMRGGGTKDGQPWNVGIRLPDENREKIGSAGTLPLMNGRAIATSGNYLNYYEVDGETFSHTINPKTGLVERNRLLSASVFAPDCATADAYATACMVLGPERAIALINATPDLDAYFLVRGEGGGLETVVSEGF